MKCCLNPVNWQSKPDPKRWGWLNFRCKICSKWLGNRPEEIEKPRRKWSKK